MKPFVRILAVLAALTALAGCDMAVFGHDDTPEIRDYDKVLIIYSAGYNTISSYLQGDIREILATDPAVWLPVKGGRKALLVFSHRTASSYDFSTLTSPVLFRISRDYDGSARCDTLLTLEPGTIITDVEVSRRVLGYVMENFPSEHYGMIYSSHGTGWLPRGYYGKYMNDDSVVWLSPRRHAAAEEGPEGAVPYIFPDPDDYPVKSIGNELEQLPGGSTWAYELELPDFARSIPMHLDYLLMDACLMGGIETAYELKDVADVIGFSATEIPAEGFYYPRIAKHLLYNASASPAAVCDDYYQVALTRSGSGRTAVVSCIDCSKLERLASVCGPLFEKYREGLDAINPSKVQGFFRHNQHYYYDLQDIMSQAGVRGAEMDEFIEALSDCIIYKASTERAMTSVVINRFCGFSMFLPCHGNDELREYYKCLAWNKATALVK